MRSFAANHFPFSDHNKHWQTEPDGTKIHVTLNVDLAPTILAATAIKAPATLQGRDIAPLYLATEKPAWRDEFFYEHASSGIRIPASEALVRKGWKYFYWPEYQLEQLSDVAADPFEENDLAGAPAHVKILTEMCARCAQLKAAAK